MIQKREQFVEMLVQPAIDPLAVLVRRMPVQADPEPFQDALVGVEVRASHDRCAGRWASGPPSRNAGTAVFGGILGVTLFGIFLTPVFCYVIQWFADRRLALPRAPRPPAELQDQGDGDHS